MTWVIGFYVLLLMYLVYILWMTLGFIRFLKPEPPEKRPPNAKFSITIPMRDEAKNLPNLFNSISELSYPTSLFEIIFVDDDSRDDSWKLVRAFQTGYRDIKIHLVSSQSDRNNEEGSDGKLSPKKKAIHKAISLSSYPYILTTDADVSLPKHWLESYNTSLHNSVADLVAGGVVIEKNTSFLSRYQHYDMLSLQAFGLGSFKRRQPVICNGANLCYKKQAYLDAEVNLGTAHIASGDDVFTLQGFRKKGFAIDYLSDPESVVWTKPLESFRELWQQRRRWARKVSSIDSGYMKAVGILITLMQLTLVLSLILGFWDPEFFLFLFSGFVLKFMVDGFSLSSMAKVQELDFCWTDFLKVSVVYPFFTLFFSLTSFYGTFDWKGRRYFK
ncbi:glycosyltransferase [Psychroflexus sp. YR1-1]|uniref:Glycosyltransferase n=1 Tax=Psychroflexus aurantiacus TaxID=2709310 RepID=A0A6B3R8U5_9FLAO|nr:glycosyltransferase [Psychroflexus aurantiacus]NEV93964.1 glycosyltransferase [Psychroflexus aurantiacus]